MRYGAGAHEVRCCYSGVVFSPVRTRHPFQEAVQQITDAIRAGDLSVADRLPSERVLARQMDISRPTLREAVKVLVQTGVLEVRPGAVGGIFVRSDTVPVQLNDDGWRLRVSEVTDVLEARRVIQINIAQLAGMRATEEDVRAMDTTLSLLRESVADRQRFMQLDERFQIAMARAAHNQVLLTQVQHLLRQVRLAKDLALRDAPPDESMWALGSLGRLLDAIRSKDLVCVVKEMDEHLAYLENIWSEELSHGQRTARALLAHPEPARFTRTRQD